MSWTSLLCPILLILIAVWLCLRYSAFSQAGNRPAGIVLGALVGIGLGMMFGCAGGWIYGVPRMPTGYHGGITPGFVPIALACVGLVLGGAYGAVAGGMVGGLAAKKREERWIPQVAIALLLVILPPLLVGIWIYAENEPLWKRQAAAGAKAGPTSAPRRRNTCGFLGRLGCVRTPAAT